MTLVEQLTEHVQRFVWVQDIIMCSYQGSTFQTRPSENVKSQEIHRVNDPRAFETRSFGVREPSITPGLHLDAQLPETQGP